MERLLVAQTGFLGDVVLTTPLLSTLRRALALESLTVLTTPQARPLVQDHPAVDKVLVDNKRGDDRGFFGMLQTARRLQRQHGSPWQSRRINPFGPLCCWPWPAFRTGWDFAKAPAGSCTIRPPGETPTDTKLSVFCV